MKTQDYTDEEFKVAVAEFERGVEYARLKESVIEAAKAWRRHIIQNGPNDWVFESKLWGAVDELNEFEAAQNLGKQV